MATRYSLLALVVAALCFGGYLLSRTDGQPSVPMAEAAPAESLTLIRLANIDSIELPIEWFSLRDSHLLEEPIELPNGGLQLSDSLNSNDVLGIPPSAWSTWLDRLPVVSQSVTFPQTSGLLLHLEPSAGVLEVENLLYEVDPPAGVKGAVAKSELPWSEGAPLSREHAPEELRCVPSVQDANPSSPPRRGSQDGLGYLQVFDDGRGVFSPAGTLKGGPETGSQAWLHVARDGAGDLWLWFAATAP